MNYHVLHHLVCLVLFCLLFYLVSLPQEMAEQQELGAALAQDDAFGQDSLDDELAVELESLLRIDDEPTATMDAATTAVRAGATTASLSAPVSAGAVGGGAGSLPSEVAAVGDMTGQLEAPAKPSASASSSSARGKATPVPG